MKPRLVIRRFFAITMGLSITGILIYLIFTLMNYFFTLTEIQVIGSGVVLAIDETRFDNNLLLISTTKISQSLKSNNPFLNEIKVTKKFPHTLIIDIKGRLPVAELVVSAGKVLIDQEGYVIGVDINQTKLPQLVFDLPVVPIGEKVVDQKLEQALKFLKLFGFHSGIKLITTADTSSLLAKIDETNILFLQSGDLDTQISSLQTILHGFRMKGTIPMTIDLRFNKPIVR